MSGLQNNSQYILSLIPINSQFNKVQFECTYIEQGYQNTLICLLQNANKIVKTILQLIEYCPPTERQNLLSKCVYSGLAKHCFQNKTLHLS